MLGSKLAVQSRRSTMLHISRLLGLLMKPSKHLVVSLLACWIWLEPAQATILETRFGMLEDIAGPDQYESGLSLDGRRIDGVEGRFSVTNLFDWGDWGDVVLISFWSGGASCCHSYQLVRLTGQGEFATRIFGGHGFQPSNFVPDMGSISFRLERSFPASVDYLQVNYDGAEVIVTTVWENDSGVEIAGPGEQVLRWDGQRPTTIFDDPSERARFRAIMKNDDLDLLRTSLSVGGEATISGGYLLGAGCWPHRCDSQFGFFAIEIATGKPFAVYSDDCGQRLFGASEATLPVPVLGFIADHIRRANRNGAPVRLCEN